MQVSESWVVYSYWSATSHRTEMSTLSLYEGMIDKYGLSPFNRVRAHMLSVVFTGLEGGQRLKLSVHKATKYRTGSCVR